MRNEVFDYGPKFRNVMSNLKAAERLTLTTSHQLNTVMLHGEQGSGTTTIASQFANQSKFEFVKLITPEKFVGVGPLGKINSIDKVFRDAYKSKSSLVVIDNIDRIVEFVQTGPDFNNVVLQALITLMSKPPTNPECKLLIIGTTSSMDNMELLGLEKHFSMKIEVGNLDQNECAAVLQEDIGISRVPIKKLWHFKSIVSDKPRKMWKKVWENYT